MLSFGAGAYMGGLLPELRNKTSQEKKVRCRIYELGGGVPVGVAAAGDSLFVAGLVSAAAAAAAAAGPAVGAGVVAG